MKKTRININLPEGDHAVVTRGDRVRSGDQLTRGVPAEIDKFNLAQLFKVSAAKALSYLTVKEGVSIEKGGMIAKRRGLLSKDLVRSPVAGEFLILDPDKAVVGIAKTGQQKPVVAWFGGIVVEGTESQLAFEVEGDSLLAKEGKGAPVSGDLTVIDGTTVLDVPIDVEEKVVVVKNAYAALVAKVDALGALAVIAEVLEEPPFTIPYLLFDSIDEIVSYSDRFALVHGDDRRLFILHKGRENKHKGKGKE